MGRASDNRLSAIKLEPIQNCQCTVVHADEGQLPTESLPDLAKDGNPAAPVPAGCASAGCHAQTGGLCGDGGAARKTRNGTLSETDDVSPCTASDPEHGDPARQGAAGSGYAPRLRRYETVAKQMTSPAIDS